MNLNQLLEFAATYNNLNWIQQTELEEIIDRNYKNITPASFDYLNSLTGYNNQLDQHLKRAENYIK